MNFKNCLPTALVLVTLSAYSQEQRIERSSNMKQDSVHSLNEVIIEENRIQLPFAAQNRNIQVISRQEIETFSGKSINELLGYVSGVDVRQRGPAGVQADISIDGGTFDQTLVLINGVKMTDPQTGHNMMNLPVSLNAIDHIEILRGSAARIYGINTLTGAINIVTVNPAETDYAVNINTGSSFKNNVLRDKPYASYAVDARLNFVQNNNKHLFSISSNEGSGYRYNTAYNNYKAFYQGRFSDGADGMIDVTAGFIDNSFGANGYYASPGDVESEEIVKTGLASVGYKKNITKSWSFFPRISYRFNKDDYKYIKQDPTRFRNIHRTHILNAELNNTIETNIGTFGLGLEGRSESINSTNLNDHQRSNLGVFAEYKFDRVKRLLVTVGSYANYNSDFGWQVLPGFDAGYNFFGNWKTYVNFGTGQRLPTYTDLYYRGPSNIGNDQLAPETSIYGEGGIKYNKQGLSFNASYFYRRTDDFIDWVKAVSTDPWQPQNFSKLDVQGYTFALNYRFKQENTRKPIISAGASYTNLSPTIKNPDDRPMISRYAVESLRHQLGATATLNYQKVSLTAGTKYCSRINYKDYTLVDARVAYSFAKGVKAYFDVSNMLDVNYIEAAAVPMPGSWYTFGIDFVRLK